MPTEFYIVLLAVALLIVAGIVIVAVQGSRRESVREREGRRDGYVRDGDEPNLFDRFRIDDCPRGKQ